MHPVHDNDAILLLAVALSSKRRPAELLEVVAAAELVAGVMPEAAGLAEAFSHLSVHGLLIGRDGGFVLSAEAQQALIGEPKKAEPAERIFWVRDQLSVNRSKTEHPALVVAGEQLVAAIAEHRAAIKAAPRNLMVPKPKPPEDTGRGPGFKKRKPMPPRRRKI